MNDNEQPTQHADDVREARAWIESLLSGNGFGADYSAKELDAWATDLLAGFRSRGPVTDAGVNEATPALLNDFYISGLRRAIEIIQNEDYPLSFGLARVDAMVSDIQDEIELAREAQQ